MATSRPRARKRGRSREPVGLTTDRVRQEALRLIDEEGLEEFSTRKLGRALGCEAMAIYWYYPSKEALLDAVVDLLVSDIPSSARGTRDWVEALRQIAHAYRGIAHAHPRAFPLLATRRFATPGAYGFLEQLFELAHREGVPDRTAARFFRVVSGYCSGVALDELAGLHQARDASADEVRAGFPRVAAVSRWLEPRHDDETFEFGLEILLDALARTARRARR